MSFGGRLKLLREENNLSREDLANKFNLSYSTIYKYETDTRFPDQDTLKIVAKYFNVSLDYLMGASEVKSPYISKKSNDDTAFSHIKNSIFSIRLKELRIMNGFTQDELAKNLNISRSSIAGYESENKEASYDTLIKLCKLFDVSVDYIIGASDIKNPYQHHIIEQKSIIDIDSLLDDLKNRANELCVSFNEKSPIDILELHDYLKSKHKK